MTAISYQGTVNDLQGLSNPGAGPFGRTEWFELLHSAGYHPTIFVAREDDDAIAMPLGSTDAGLVSLTNWYAFTWSYLWRGDRRHEALLRQIAWGISIEASAVTLTKLPDEDGTATRLERAFRSAGWVVLREACDTNHVLTLAGRSYAEYLAARPGALRTTLKRKARKVNVEILTTFQSEAWDFYEEVYAASWKPEEGDPALLRAFAEAEGAAGRLRLGLARHDGAVVAAQFWTVEGDTAWIHKLAHLESAKPLSAGTTLSAALFEHVIDRDRVERVDFGTGDDPYKRDWMEQVRLRWRLTCLRRGDPRNWPALAKAFARKLVSRAGAG